MSGRAEAAVSLVAALVLLCTDAVLQTGMVSYLWRDVTLPTFMALEHGFVALEHILVTVAHVVGWWL